MECVHYWILNLKNHGTCQKCGEDKQFYPYEALDIALSWRGESPKQVLSKMFKEQTERIRRAQEQIYE
jgi:hypothetical protein